MIKSLLYPLHALLHRTRMEQSMREEMQMHIELQALEYEQQGLSKSEALRKAKRAFGNQTSIQETCRASWGMRMWDDLVNDLHFAVFQIKKHPLYSSVAVLSLAVGIGVNLALLSTINSILLKPIAIEHAEQLREIQWKGPQINGFSQGLRERQPDGSTLGNTISYPLYRNFKTAAGNMADIFCWDSVRFSVDFGDNKRTESGLLISENYFEALKATPLIGSLSIDPDSQNIPERSVWISEKLWRQEYSQKPNTVGKSILIENQVFTIAGVLPSSLQHLNKGSHPNFFFLLPAQPVVAKYFPLESGKHFWLSCAARLRHTAFDQDLQQILDQAITEADIEFHPSSESVPPVAVIKDASRGIDRSNRSYSRSLTIPILMSAVLLLVSCINLAGLQFSRNYKRIPELSIRTALGASRSRLVRQILTETFFLCFAGSLNGVFIALLSHRFLTPLFVSDILDFDTTPDVRMFLLFALIVTICTLVVGLFPAIKITSSHQNLHVTTKSESSRNSLKLGKIAISAQIVCTLTLVYVSFLFANTLRNLYQTDSGFNTCNLLLFSLQGEKAYAQDRPDAAIREEVAARVNQIPGVTSTSYAGLILLSNSNYSTTIHKEDSPIPMTQDLPVYSLDVSADFFNTLQIPIIAGRTFDPRILESNKNQIIISHTLAKKAFPDSNPVGKTLHIYNEQRQIIGVCGDIQYRDFRDSAKNVVYLPMYPKADNNSMFDICSFYVRTQLSPLALSEPIHKIISSSFPGMYVEQIQTMEMNIDNLVRNEKNISILSIGFASITVLLTCIGLFALVNYDVTSRTQEIGIRMALGASRKKIVRWILRRSLSPLLPGVLVGIPLALCLKHWMNDRLYQITDVEIEGLIFSLTLILVSASVAVIYPCMRTSKLNPSIWLRNE